MERTISSIDVGTTKVCTLIGEVDEEEELHIVGVGIVPSHGLHKGVVVDVENTIQAIATSVEKAERISGYRIERAYVGVAGAYISAFNSRGMVATFRSRDGITKDDIARALDAAQAVAIPHNHEIIHIVPRSYVVDGQNGVRDPLGMHGLRLEAEAHIITGAASFINNLIKCVEANDIEVEDLVLAPLASAEAVLTKAEREMGVALADIGGGTTDLAIFTKGSILHTAVLATGGNHLTTDVAMGLCAPFNVAEEIKEKYGYTQSESVEGETIEVAAFGEGPYQVPRSLLSQIIKERVEEIFELIRKEIEKSGCEGLLPAGVVMCGGTAELAGITELGRRIMRLPMRVGVPHNLHGLVDVLSSPAYATGVGLLFWSLRQETAPSPKPESTFRRFIRWLGNLLPG